MKDRKFDYGANKSGKPDFSVSPGNKSIRAEVYDCIQCGVCSASCPVLYLMDLAQDLARQVGYFGYTVRTFSHIADIKDAMNTRLPAVIIADIMFPEGDLAGPEAINNIRKMHPANFPVIFISARNDIKARLMAFRAGGNDYFTKPVDIIRLIDRLDSLIMGHGSDPYRILVIDDDYDLADQVSLKLKEAGFITEIETDPLKVLDILKNFRPDLILLDLHMPGCNGIELAAIIRQQEVHMGIPIVFLSSETDRDKQLSAMREGGDDFLPKTIDYNLLISMIMIRAKRARILRSYMVKDGLTGLLNHSTTKEQLSIEIANAQRNNKQLSFALMDIDKFKLLNDTHGHLAGDRAVISLSRLLQLRLRKSDIIGRFGGDEFAVILSDTDKQATKTIFEEILNAFSLIRQRSDVGDTYLTFSCGIASYPDYDNAVNLNNAADIALYNAKENGRNRVVLADS